MTHRSKQVILNNFFGRQASADDVQLQYFRQFVLIGEQSVEIGLSQSAESFIRRGQQGQFSGTSDVLHEIGGKVFHDTVEFVQNSVALLLQSAINSVSHTRILRVLTSAAVAYSNNIDLLNITSRKSLDGSSKHVEGGNKRLVMEAASPSPQSVSLSSVIQTINTQYKIGRNILTKTCEWKPACTGRHAQIKLFIRLFVFSSLE